MTLFTKLFIGILLIITVIAVFSMQQEIVPVHNGLGWDGIDYAQFMEGFAQKLLAKFIPKHYVLRYSYLGWGSVMIHFFGIENIVLFSQITNILLIISSLLVFAGICKLLQFSEKQFVLGTTFLFFNFAILKFTQYLPVLSDTFGFFIGLLSSYFYLKKYRLGLLLSIIIGIGFFPTVVFYSLLLLFNSDVSKNFKTPNNLLRWIPMVGFAAVFSALVFVLGDRFLNMQTSQVTPISKSWLLLAVPIVLYYLWIITDMITTNFSIKNIFKSLNIKNLIIFVAIVAMLKIMQHYFGNSEIEILSGTKFVLNIVKHSIQVPAGFVVAHAMFFGVLPIYCCLKYWTMIKESFMLLSLGERFFIYLILLLVLNSESRQLINLYPFLLIYILKSIEKVKMYWSEIVIFAMFSLVQSGFWYKINTLNPSQFAGSLQDIDAQRFFRFMGPWVSEQSYLENFVLVFSLLILYAITSELSKQTFHLGTSNQ